MQSVPPKPASLEHDSKTQEKDTQPAPPTLSTSGLEEGQIRTSPPPLPTEAVPPLPTEDVPPLPDEPVPAPKTDSSSEQKDDGWEPVWDGRAQAFYFYNRLTQVSQWENPRVPDVQPSGPPGIDSSEAAVAPVAGYNPAIHGDYDPNADYAKPGQSTDRPSQSQGPPGAVAEDAYAATGAFNRFTGKWQNADFTTERFSDEAKSKRQMNAFFDVDAAANSHDGRSLRAERQQKKLSKRELKDFKEKRREKKEEKRRAWLKD